MVVAKGRIRRAAAPLMLCVSAGAGSCSSLDTTPYGLSAIEEEAAAERLLSRILQSCTVQASGGCRRALPGDCLAIVKVDGMLYRCPSP